MEEAPRREKGLPILYNEYCAAWGSPSEEKVAAMVEALRGKPISYFVIDAGWYKPEDKAWDNALGDWIPSKALRKQLPQLIVENCASGGHRLAPGWLTATEMSSFSDAHECVAIPIIAANLHCCLLPRQSQIWAVLRQTDDPHRLVYSLAATFLGRMCLSGDVTGLSPEQWLLADEAMDFSGRWRPSSTRAARSGSGRKWSATTSLRAGSASCAPALPGNCWGFSTSLQENLPRFPSPFRKDSTKSAGFMP